MHVPHINQNTTIIQLQTEAGRVEGLLPRLNPWQEELHHQLSLIPLPWSTCSNKDYTWLHKELQWALCAGNAMCNAGAPIQKPLETANPETSYLYTPAARALYHSCYSNQGGWSGTEPTFQNRWVIFWPESQTMQAYLRVFFKLWNLVAFPLLRSCLPTNSLMCSTSGANMGDVFFRQMSAQGIDGKALTTRTSCKSICKSSLLSWRHNKILWLIALNIIVQDNKVAFNMNSAPHWGAYDSIII